MDFVVLDFGFVRHEAAREMRVWPLGAGLQERHTKISLIYNDFLFSLEFRIPFINYYFKLEF